METYEPGEILRERLLQRQESLARLTRLEGRISPARLPAFLLFVGVGGQLLTATHPWTPWWLLPGGLFFTALVVWHDRVIRLRKVMERRIEFHQRGLDRLEHRWPGRGDGGLDLAPTAHPYAVDLDVFGKGSLFELLCTARTPMGRRTLAGWLSHPGGVGGLKERQEAVLELRGELDLREELWVVGSEVAPHVRSAELGRFGEDPQPRNLRGTSVVVLWLSLQTVLTGVLWGTGTLGGAWFLGAVLLGAVAGLWFRKLVSTYGGVDEVARQLRLLQALSRSLEGRTWGSPPLRRLGDTLRGCGKPASRRVGQLLFLFELMESRRNQFFALVAPFLLWGTQCALAIESWRLRYGGSLSRWCEAVGEWEAMLALASHSWEHPDDVFPEFVEGPPRLRGASLGNVLMAQGACVRNGVELDANRRILVVSGSNMSGKSTYLRTVGLNVVLAMAGSVVRGRQLSMSPLQVGASVRVLDSLQEGTSRFMAEIRQLKRVADAVGQGPCVLFLFDEILHGTNSSDRRTGAHALVKWFLEREALGIFTTHDLALAALADAHPGLILNQHFAGTVKDGRMSFNYCLSDGVVEESNALDLMRSIGLEL